MNHDKLSSKEFLIALREAKYQRATPQQLDLLRALTPEELVTLKSLPVIKSISNEMLLFGSACLLFALTVWIVVGFAVWSLPGRPSAMSLFYLFMAAIVLCLALVPSILYDIKSNDRQLQIEAVSLSEDAIDDMLSLVENSAACKAYKDQALASGRDPVNLDLWLMRPLHAPDLLEAKMQRLKAHSSLEAAQPNQRPAYD